MDVNEAENYVSNHACPECGEVLNVESIIGEPGEVRVRCLDCHWCDEDAYDPTPGTQEQVTSRAGYVDGRWQG